MPLVRVISLSFSPIHALHQYVVDQNVRGMVTYVYKQTCMQWRKGHGRKCGFMFHTVSYLLHEKKNSIATTVGEMYYTEHAVILLLQQGL